MIKNIVFDLGGVLVNFNPTQYFKSFGFDENINNELTKKIFGTDKWNEYDRGMYKNSKELEEDLIKLTPHLKDEIKLVINNKWVETLIEKKDTSNYLEELKQKGFKIFILSNISKEAYDYVEKYDFFKNVDGQMLSYQVKSCKPEQKIYNAFFEKYNINPKESIFIDDRKDNIEVSEKLGMNGVVFDNIESVKEKVSNIIKNNNL